MLLYGLEKDPVFRHLDTRLLVTCPANGPDEGGLYLLDFGRNGWTKLYAGGCTGMALVRDRLIVATDDNRLLAFDNSFRTVTTSEHGKLDFHGVTKFDDHVVMVAETAVNAIGCYEADTFKRIGEIRLHPENKDVHHINDIWLEGTTLYVSMFSPYDNWYLEPLNQTGAIVAIDMAAFNLGGRLDITPADHVVVGNLYMPHSVSMHKNRLAYCDSMTFRAVVGSEMAIQAAGFTRGLVITDDTIFIGQSRMRHVLRIPHLFSNCILDGGIYAYNPEFRVSRFVPLPEQQVYQIMLIGPETGPFAPQARV